MAQLRKADAERRLAKAYGPDHLESLERGFRVLRAFNDQHRQMSLSEVALAVDLPKASVRRALNTLEKLGYVRLDGRVYRLTPSILRLASAYVCSNRLSAAAQSICEEVVEAVQEACSVAVLDGQQVVMIAHAEPTRMQPVSAGIGYRLPAFCTSLGRAILATSGNDDLDAFLAEAELRSVTKFTITDQKKLRDRILKDRRLGYSLADQESDYGWRSISVPIIRNGGTVTAALNVAARIEQVPLKVMSETFLPILKRAAEKLSSIIKREESGKA